MNIKRLIKSGLVLGMALSCGFIMPMEDQSDPFLKQVLPPEQPIEQQTESPQSKPSFVPTLAEQPQQTVETVHQVIDTTMQGMLNSAQGKQLHEDIKKIAVASSVVLATVNEQQLLHSALKYSKYARTVGLMLGIGSVCARLASRSLIPYARMGLVAGILTTVIAASGMCIFSRFYETQKRELSNCKQKLNQALDALKNDTSFVPGECCFLITEKDSKLMNGLADYVKESSRGAITVDAESITGIKAKLYDGVNDFISSQNNKFEQPMLETAKAYFKEKLNDKLNRNKRRIGNTWEWDFSTAKFETQDDYKCYYNAIVHEK